MNNEKQVPYIDPDTDKFLSSRIRNLIALSFAVGFIIICFANMSNQNINKEIYNILTNMVNLVMGYYFGNRGK